MERVGRRGGWEDDGVTEKTGMGDGAEVEDVLQARARLGEGPAWDAENGVLWWVDLLNQRVHRFTPETGEDRHWEVSETAACVIPARGERVLVALRSRLALLDPAAGTLEPFADLDAGGGRKRLNDGKCDAAGRLWVGSTSPDEEGGASLFRVDSDGSVRTVERGFGVCNGTAWSPEGRTLYLADSPRKIIYAYDFDMDRGEIANRRVFADLNDGDAFPDGMAVDEEGCVWSAQWQGGCVIRFGPDGRERERISIPVPIPTSCAFGGAGLRDLYVTTASVDMGQDELERHVNAGDLFRLRTGARGLPAHPFAGPVG